MSPVEVEERAGMQDGHELELQNCHPHMKQEAVFNTSTWGGLVRELSVVGPALTPSSVYTHCLSGSCDQHRGHKEVGTLLNSPGQGLLGERLQVVRNTPVVCKKRQVTIIKTSHMSTAVTYLGIVQRRGWGERAKWRWNQGISNHGNVM